MKVWTNLGADALERIARKVGVRAVNMRRDGRANRFTLRTVGARPRYRRLSQSIRNKDGKRRTVPGAVCWHGHRDFFMAVFADDPGARIQTAMADYKGIQEFYAAYPETAGRGGGTSYYGVRMTPYSQACACDESAPFVHRNIRARLTRPRRHRTTQDRLAVQYRMRGGDLNNPI